jgi:electron transfer flavoprotein alpha subunit
VAINSDPHAAIFQVADYCIGEDLESFIPVLLEEFRQFSAAGKKKGPDAFNP